MYYDLRTTNSELLKASHSATDIHAQVSFCISALWREPTEPGLPSSLTPAAFGHLQSGLLQWPNHDSGKNPQQPQRGCESTLQLWPWSASVQPGCCPTAASSLSWRKGGTGVTSPLGAPSGDRAGENSWQRCGDALTVADLTTGLSWGIKKHFCYRGRGAKGPQPVYFKILSITHPLLTPRPWSLPSFIPCWQSNHVQIMCPPLQASHLHCQTHALKWDVFLMARQQ